MSQVRQHLVWELPEGISLAQLDLRYYLPLFLSGLVETEPPLDFIAQAVLLLESPLRHPFMCPCTRSCIHPE